MRRGYWRGHGRGRGNRHEGPVRRRGQLLSFAGGRGGRAATRRDVGGGGLAIRLRRPEGQARRQRGYDLSTFRCREITAADFAASDLILAMDRDNLAQLEARRPAGNVTPIRLLLGESEVPDPYFGAEDGFGAMLDLVEQGVRALLAKG